MLVSQGERRNRCFFLICASVFGEVERAVERRRMFWREGGSESNMMMSTDACCDMMRAYGL
jgi:hypothetical protein